uniref:Uncharacterized protein n=1 Tax=Tanacetum cinerariifolium TaxID=118510 RepID=A0A699HU33_TANCI|nr:hypothetical protein [Tanacetum cinerariifolium]
MRRIEEEARRLAVIREMQLAKSIGISQANYEGKFETSSKQQTKLDFLMGQIGKQTWWYRVESNTLTREDAELRFFERLLQKSNLGGIEYKAIVKDLKLQHQHNYGARAEHTTPGTLSTIVDHTSSNRMNHQEFFTRKAYILLAGPVRKGQPHIVHVKLEQGGLAAPLLARDMKTKLGGFTYIEEAVKISSNSFAIVLKMEKIMTMIIQESEECAPELQALIKMITRYWVGKGPTAIPDGATYGLLISGLSVDPSKSLLILHFRFH